MAKKGRKVDWSKLRGLLWLSIAVCLFSYTIFNSYQVIMFQEKQLNETIQMKEDLQKQKEALEKELELLNNEDYITRYARENYIFTKDGETVIILPQKE